MYDASLQDKYKRSLADRENVRTRLEKQVKDGKLFGIQSFCKDLLDVSISCDMICCWGSNKTTLNEQLLQRRRFLLTMRIGT